MSLSAFRIDIEADGIAVVTFDMPHSKVNTLGQAMQSELEQVLDYLESQSNLAGLLFRSGKPGMFIAGADLKELADANVTPEITRRLVARGLDLIARFENLPYPTVALIDGPCVGGGLELVLGFDARLASNHSKTELGLPETKIGLIPGWGGTQRLSRVVGPALAAEMIASGDSVNTTRAREIGLIFDTVPSDQLLAEGKRLIEHLSITGSHHEARRQKRQPVGLSEDQLAFTIGVARAQATAKTKGHYPAPIVALDVIAGGCNLPLADGLAVETEAFIPLVGSPISRNLIALFFLNQRLAKDPGVAERSLVPEPISRVGVIGAGLMGAGIAGAHVRRGVATLLTDVNAQALDHGAASVAKSLKSRVEIGRMTPDEMLQALSRLTATAQRSALGDCDLVIEAIIEKEEAKSALFRELTSIVKPGVIVVSNTSTISITRLSEAAPDASRFAGLHFFNPVERMQLVEVIRGVKTSDQTVATLVALAKRVGKSPIVVRDCPGFLVNRILFPYLNEALALLEEGVSPRAVDAAATAFGMPMGPISLSDVVGLDTCWYAGRVIQEAYADRARSSPLLADLVQAGRLGQKSGAGFYSYAKGPRGLDDPALTPFLDHRRHDAKVRDDGLTDRLLLPMVVEASRVLMESVVRNAADVDMGLILGIGFPTFRGGLLRWADSLGLDEVVRRLDRLTPLGKRFEPTPLLQDLASRRGGFFAPAPG